MIDFVKLMDPKKLRDDKSEQLFEDPNWLAESKINGRRIQCLIDNAGRVSFAGRYAREGHENIDILADKFYKIRDDVSALKLPKQTLLDGEVHLPGRSLSQTLQIINAPSIDAAVGLQEQVGFIFYVVFDIIALDAKSLLETSTMFRKAKISRLIPTTCNISTLQFFTSTEEKQNLWQSILTSNDEEKGMVFKFCDADYECTRSKWWRKLKKFETHDAVIMGFKYDKNYPSDFVSSIRVSQYRRNILTHVADVGGLTKEQASDFRSNIDLYMGKVIQFKADARTASSYKNPRFDCLRPDKLPTACLWEI